MQHILNAIRDDTYLRVLDLRKNKFTEAVLSETYNYNLVKTMQTNEYVTNLDLRENEGLTKQLKFKLSLVMLRNIDRLR